ncbi:MAG: hypothetical protein K0R45_1144 [Pseudomonas sp.]|nr:hypothetical protein [Pseudomonas sp.]
MNKLRALTAHLSSFNLVLPEQFDSWVTDATQELVWKPDENGMYMGDMSYTGHLSMDDFSGNPSRLMALLGSWLVTHDDDRDDLPAPVMAIDVTDLAQDLADVTISIQFAEAQYLSEDPNGDIKMFGKTWSPIPYELWTAEQGEVVRND